MDKSNELTNSELYKAATEANLAGRGRKLFFAVMLVFAVLFSLVVIAKDSNRNWEVTEESLIRIDMVAKAANAYKARHGAYPSRLDKAFLKEIEFQNYYGVPDPTSTANWLSIRKVLSKKEVETEVMECPPDSVLYCCTRQGDAVNAYFIVGKDSLGRIGKSDGQIYIRESHP